ncbi:MAG: O-antigen ligase family protein [Pyrinomonadaceae bacterium]
MIEAPVNKATISLEPSRIASTIFFLLLLIPAFGTVLFGAVDEITWSVFYLAWTALVLLWLVDAWMRGGLLVSASQLLIPVAALVLIGAIQLLPIPYLGSVDPSSTWFFELRLIVLFTFFAGYLTFINSEGRLRRALNFVVIFGSVMAFYGILQRLASPEGIYGLRQTPQAIPFGPFVNQHHFAAFMEMTGGLTLGILFGQKTARDRRILLTVAVIIMGAAVAFTGSRGGMLSFAFVLAFVLLVRLVSRETTSDSAGARHLGVIVAGAAIIAIVFMLVLYLGGNDQLLRGAGAATAGADISTGRFHFWPIAVRIFLEHPLLGSGFDSYAVEFTRFDTWPGVFRVEQAHNDYLQTLSDAGIAGFLCVATFIFLLFRQGLRLVRESRDYRRYTAIGALAGCFGILVHGFFDFPLRTYSNSFFFLLLAAIATVPIAGEHQRRRRTHRQ